MANKNAGYVIGGLQILAGVILTIFQMGYIGVPLIISGVGTVAGTALTPQPPRQKTLSNSPNFGIDQFENPRGRDAFLPIGYGVFRVRLPVIQESVASVAENSTPGVDAQKKQGFKWVGGMEGPNESFTDIEINDRKVFNDPQVDVSLGKGDGTKKTFEFLDKWVWLGTDEKPAVEVKVDGVVKSFTEKSATQILDASVPAQPATTYEFGIPHVAVYKKDIVRTDKRERVLEGSIRLFMSGPGYARAELLRRVGTYKWSAQKLSPRKVRVTFLKWPPKGYKIEATYSYLGTTDMAVYRDVKGRARAVFGTAVAAGKKVTASYVTTNIPELKIEFRPGTPDQAPIYGWTDQVDNSHNPKVTLLQKDQPIPDVDGERIEKLPEVDDLRIVLLAPRGFIQYKDDGGTSPVTAKIRIEYRKVGTTPWVILRSPSGTEFLLSAARSQPVRWEIGIRRAWQDLIDTGDSAAFDALEAFDRGVYDVRVTRTTAVTTDPLVSHELHFQVLTEVLFEGFSYPGTTLLALSGLPTEAASGGSLRVTALMNRGKVYDPRTVVAGQTIWRDLGSSQNPMLALRDLVTSGEGAFKERYGGGYFFTGMDFLMGVDGPTQSDGAIPPGLRPATTGDGFIAAADFCDEWVYRPGDSTAKPATATGNGERRCRLNMVFDTPMSLMEAAADLAFLAYCFASLQGAKWRFPLDQDGPPVYTFVDDVDSPNQNCDGFHMSLEPWGKTPTHIGGQFWNELNNYQRDELLLPVKDLAEGTPLNVKEVAMVGVTRETEAGRMLRHLAEQAALHPYPCRWRAHPGVMFLEAGDIVTVKTRGPYATGSEALELKVRILSCQVTRGEDGKMEMRYAGRVMNSKGYDLKPITMPVTRASVVKRVKDQEALVSGLTGRVV